MVSPLKIVYVSANSIQVMYSPRCTQMQIHLDPVDPDYTPIDYGIKFTAFPLLAPQLA